VPDQLTTNLPTRDQIHDQEGENGAGALEGAKIRSILKGGKCLNIFMLIGVSNISLLRQ